MLGREDSRSTKMAWHDQMSAKRRLNEVMMDKLVGTSKVLSILHFPRDLVLDSQGEGWTGVLLLTDGKSTFTQELPQSILNREEVD